MKKVNLGKEHTGVPRTHFVTLSLKSFKNSETINIEYHGLCNLIKILFIFLAGLWMDGTTDKQCNLVLP